MRKCSKIFHYSILLMFCQVVGLFLGGSAVFADVDNFYFDDFTANYILTKDADGISHLEVVENLTAVFPNFNQNKGICRDIPFTNQGGANITIENLTKNFQTLLRNGEIEPIYSIEKAKDFYEVCTGTDDYVLGEQTYTLTYNFDKVVTDFDDYQELYWDTNGNGWSQNFNHLTAIVHLDQNVLPFATGEAWCYVGKYGDSGQNRCQISKTEDGFTFRAINLAPGENLTFDIEFSPGTFNVPLPPENYFYVYVLAVVVIICIIAIALSMRYYFKNRDKETYYKGLFIKPEFQPHSKYRLEEAAEIYLGKKKDLKVAMLLDLIVKKKISLIRDEEKRKSWSITINNLSGATPAEIDLLKILNGGESVKVGDTIKIKQHTATSAMIALRRSFESAITTELKKDELVEERYWANSIINIASSTTYSVLGFSSLAVWIIAVVAEIIENESGLAGGRYIIAGEAFLISSILLSIITATTCSVFYFKVRQYRDITKKGLELSRYMDGLKLYIKMAEKDRLEFLQSVKKADVSPEGIVKLYEKLLPYAAVFGLEKTWLKEMAEYCEVQDIKEPDYLLTGIAISDFARATRNVASIADSSTRMSSSGGSSSSGFSGGFGGGFSGGGGGGGGGGGR